METSRDDVGIAIRSAFLKRENKQRFSIFVLIIVSVLLVFFESIKVKPIDNFRSFVKDIVYRGALIATYPSKSFSSFYQFMENHINLYSNYKEVITENKEQLGYFLILYLLYLATNLQIQSFLRKNY